MFVCRESRAPLIATIASPTLASVPVASGDWATISLSTYRPLASYEARLKRAPILPVNGACGAGALAPECDAFSSPTIRFMRRRNSSPVRAPATCGAIRCRTASQFAPCIAGS